MNKAQLIEAIVAKTGLKKKDAEAAVAATVDAVSEALVAGDKVQISGLGSFEVKTRAARTGRNPRTGEPVEIPASKYVSFSAGSVLKDKVN